MITLNEFCKKMKVTRRTMYRMLADGKFPFAIKFGREWRFDINDVQKYLNSLRDYKEKKL